MSRLFVAVWPPASVVAGLDVLVDVAAPVRWVGRERRHVTLRFLGDVAAEAVPSVGEAVAAGALAAAAAAAVASSLRFEARLGAGTATFGRSVLHVPVAGLDEAAAAVGEALAAPAVAGVVPAGADDRPFVGHLTLGRAKGRRDDVRPWAGLEVPEAARAPWPVREVTLVASVGGRYEVVRRAPLA